MRAQPILLLAVGLPWAGCGDSGTPPSGDGTLVVSTSTAGDDPDPDGFQLTIDGVDSLALLPSGTAEVVLPAGRHTLSLLDVASHCSVTPAATLEVDVSPGSTKPVAFEVTCPLTGVRVAVTTTGLDLDTDGYRVLMDGSGQGTISPNDTVTLRRLEVGSRTIALAGLAGNCAVEDPTARTVTVVTAQVAAVEFAVVCTATRGVIGVIITGSGVGAVHQATVDGGTPFQVGPGDRAYLDSVPAGAHVVSLSPRVFCSAAAIQQTVTVTGGDAIRDTAEVTFKVTCEAPPTRARIAFVRRAQPGPDGRPTPGTTLEIYIANADGSGATRLTSGESPAWSPDGRRIAFHRVKPYDPRLYVINVDGSGERLIARGGNPAWSPDGTQIVFNTLVGDGSGGIFVINADGSRLTRLIRNDFADPGSRIDWTGWPEWSPDGRISFVRTAGYDYEPWRTYVMNADGSDPRILDVSPLHSGEHAWSPDGSRIAGTSGVDIGSVGSSGSDFRTHHDGFLYAGHPDWSPDGGSLVFDQFKTTVGCDPPACPIRIYIVSIEGGPARQLIPELEHASAYWDEQPAWARVSE